jgi:hypothetical protein
LGAGKGARKFPGARKPPTTHRRVPATLQTQVIRVVAMVAAKVGVEARRERDRERVLAEMARDLRASDKA